MRSVRPGCAGWRRGAASDAQRLRYAPEPAGAAGRAAQAVRGRDERDARRVDRTRALEPDARDDVCGIRAACAREPEQRYRSRHGRAAFRDGRPRGRRAVRCAAGARAARRQRQPAGRGRFPPALRDRARAVEGTRRDPRAAAALRYAAVAEGVRREDQRRRAVRHAIHSLRIGVSAMR